MIISLFCFLIFCFCWYKMSGQDIQVDNVHILYQCSAVFMSTFYRMLQNYDQFTVLQQSAKHLTHQTWSAADWMDKFINDINICFQESQHIHKSQNISTIHDKYVVQYYIFRETLLQYKYIFNRSKNKTCHWVFFPLQI